MPNAEKIEDSTKVEKVVSYEIFYDNQSVLSVELNEIGYQDTNSVSASSSAPMNGNYAVSFDLPTPAKRHFLQVLRLQNLKWFRRE